MGNEVSVCGPKSINLGPGPIDYSVNADLGYARPDMMAVKPIQAPRKPTPAQTSESAKDLLHKAAASGSTSIMEQLISQKCVALDSTDDRGNTALHKAAWHGKLEAVRLLVKHGAKTSLANSTGKTPLAFAKQMGHADTAEYLQDMMQRHSPEKIKSMFRSKGKTSNCAKVFGPRQSMKATAWLIPGAPEVANTEERPTVRSPSAPSNMHLSPAAQTPAQLQRAQSATATSHHQPRPTELRLPAHQIPPAVVCTVSSTPGAQGQRAQQTLFSEQQQQQQQQQQRVFLSSPSTPRKSPEMPKLDLAGLAARRNATAAEEEALSGRSTSRREDMPEAMWQTEDKTASAPPPAHRKPSTPQARPASTHMASPRAAYPMPIPVERVVQGAGGHVRVVQVAQRGVAMPTRSPSFALV